MWIDAHAHLDLYGDDLSQALAEVQARNILTFGNSLDLEGYVRTSEIARGCALVVPCVGVHPWMAVANADRLEEYRDHIAQAPMLGEVGLDYYFEKDPTTYPLQRKVFDLFLQAAQEQDKVVNVHAKGAEADVLKALQEHSVHRAIIHWYSGPLDVLQQLIQWDAYFTIGVEVNHSYHIRTIAGMIPANRLLVETDNPAGPREWVKGPGMPSLLGDVLAGVAMVRGMSARELEDAIQANWAALVASDPWLPQVCGRWLAGV